MDGPLTALDKLRMQIDAQRMGVKRALLARLTDIDPYEFEHLVSDLLQRMRFLGVEVTRKQKDGGVDLRANFSIGLTEVKTIAQVKRVRSTVGVKPVKELYANLAETRGDVHLALFITTSGFSRDAVEWVRRSNIPIALIDGERLAELFAEYGLMVEEVELPNPLRLATLPDQEADVGGEPGPASGTPAPRTVREAVLAALRSADGGLSARDLYAAVAASGVQMPSGAAGPQEDPDWQHRIRSTCQNLKKQGLVQLDEGRSVWFATRGEADTPTSPDRIRRFRWDLSIDPEGTYALECRYLPDESRNLTVSGKRVSRDRDFRPAREALFRQIADWMRGLFPDLDREHLSARAWSGVHRVYPADQYATRGRRVRRT